MNVQLLVDSIVRQMAELVAHIATSRGARAPLARIEDLVFLELAEQLQQAGVSRKVAADMFGLALRSYLRKIRRLTESSTVEGRSLWEAVIRFLAERSVVQRAELFEHFRLDDPELIAGVLKDLSDNGLVFRSGQRTGTAYRLASDHELGTAFGGASDEELDPVVWALVYRLGPLTLARLSSLVRSDGVEAALGRLLALGRVERQIDGEEITYLAREFMVPLDAEIGWEAAVFDHVQAVMRTIGTRLRLGAAAGSHTGGSTYSMQVWKGHPMETEVVGQLDRFRTELSELRARVRSYNAEHQPDGELVPVTVYAGQFVDIL